jgi:hemerythrin
MGSKWSTEFITGLKEIDEHHFTIIKKLYEIEQLIQINPTKSEIMDALLFLESYTQMHFKFEESLMAEQNCPAAKENKQQHAMFIDKVHGFNQNFAHNDMMDVDLKDIAVELSNWIINHILQVDMKLKEN